MTTAASDRAHQYQRWRSESCLSHWTWPAIVANGISLSLKHAKTRVLILTSGTVVLAAVGIFYAISILESLVGTEEAKGLYDFLNVILHIDITGITRLAEFRDILWRSTFLVAIRMQMIWVMLIVARIGAGVIANDLKARALPIYFSKPITPTTYLLGKWMIVAFFVSLVMLIPDIIALGLGVTLTGGPGTMGQVFKLGLELLACGVVVCIVTGSIILALSSITSDQRYVTVGWVAVCLLPIFAQKIIFQSLPPESVTGWLGCVSLYDNLAVVMERLLYIREGLESTSLPVERFARALGRPVDLAKAVTVLGAVTVAAAVFSWRRVVRFSRMAAST